MVNPVLDQERVQHLCARQHATPKKALLAAWPRPDKELPLVSLEVTWVRFSTLNHRTKSEQMRVMEQTGRPDLFNADPTGPEAQKEQVAILAGQEGFDELKTDLKERGQQEPAVVTAEGVLINGNRRSAALRSLFVDDGYQPSRYVRCLVLPADATMPELVDLETELQIAKDFREAYTWVNEALLIEEIFNREDNKWDRVASRMHKDPAKVRAQYEKLQQLHQLVAMSNGRRHYADFVANESAFEELARHIKGKAPAEANSVRSAYFLGTLTGVNYRALRHLQRADASALVRREIEADITLRPLLQTPSKAADTTAEIDILDDVLGGGDGGGAEVVDDLTAVLSFFAQHGGGKEVDLGGSQVSVDDLMKSVQVAVNLAAEEASEQSEDSAAITAPLSKLAAARKKVDQAVEALAKARAFPEWKEDDFQARVAEMKAALAGLETSA